MKVIVSGTRHLHREHAAVGILGQILKDLFNLAREIGEKQFEVVQGESKGEGIDKWADVWTQEAWYNWGPKIVSTGVPTLTDEHPLTRNTRMILEEHSDADYLVSVRVNNSPGTTDARNKMRHLRHSRISKGETRPVLIEIDIFE